MITGKRNKKEKGLLNNKMFALKLILGHLIGDYILQTDYMALNKVRPDLKGYWSCFLHCLIYSICVACLIGSGHAYMGQVPWIVLMVFVAHFPIDKFSFGKLWLKYILKKNHPSTLTETPNTIINNSIRLFYYNFVYVVVDNTFHLIFMVAGVWFFFPELL